MLDIEPSVILWNIINIFVLFLLLKKFLFKPVTRVLDNRAAAIRRAAEEAAADRQKAGETLAGYEEKLAAAREEADQILGRARQRGQQEYRGMLEKAREDADRLIRAGQTQINAQRQAMLFEVRQEVAELALAAAAKAAGRSMDTADDRALVESFLSASEEAAAAENKDAVQSFRAGEEK
ncbi:MAG: F0F1 ATP synthase subunit B [Peptococcaceae bacterium]|nr:F0F1 ATP synthase subunit B [Peptococcaceae bacterium]